MRRLGAIALALLLVAAACGDRAVETADEPFVPRQLVTVESSTPDPLVVPTELPDGFDLEYATIVDTRREVGDHFMLFGEADQPDLADGKQLLVGFFSSSVYGLFDCEVDIGETGTCGGWTVAPLGHPDCNSDCWAFVMGRNVTETEVATAAAGLTFEGSDATMAAEALPAGVTELVDARVSVYEGLTAPGAQSISHFGRDSRSLSITAVDGGSALADLYRFFVDEDGAAAPFDSWGALAVGTIRVDGDTVIAALASGFTQAEIDSVADAMQRGGDEAWERLRAEASNRTLDELVLNEGDDPLVATVGGRFSGGQWAVSFTEAGELGVSQSISAYGPDPDDFAGSSGGPLDPGSPDEVVIAGGGGFAGGSGFVGNMHTGFAPNATATVTVMLGEQEFAAEVSEPSTLPGQPRAWAVFVESPDPIAHSPQVVIARDATGAEIGRATAE